MFSLLNGGRKFHSITVFGMNKPLFVLIANLMSVSCLDELWKLLNRVCVHWAVSVFSGNIISYAGNYTDMIFLTENG